MKKYFIFLAIILYACSALFSDDSSSAVAYKTIFAHGILTGPDQMERFVSAMATTEKIAVTFPDAQKATKLDFNTFLAKTISLFTKRNVNRKNMHMAQKEDIETLNALVDLSLSQPDHDTKLILYGCSRGSATIINYMAQYNNPNIAALVLDGSPACMHEVLAPILIKRRINPVHALSIFHWLFPNYTKQPIIPFTSIKKITNKDLPILLIHSQEDVIVPYSHTLLLYQEFKNQGFTNIHLIPIIKGRHAGLLLDDDVKNTYLQAVHSFYKQYHLPYNPDFATIDLSAYHLDEQAVLQAINDYRKFIKDHRGSHKTDEQERALYA